VQFSWWWLQRIEHINYFPLAKRKTCLLYMNYVYLDWWRDVLALETKCVYIQLLFFLDLIAYVVAK